MPSRSLGDGCQSIQAALALEGVQLGAALEREGFLYWAATPVSWPAQEDHRAKQPRCGKR
ncbi:hypothetical protein ACNKHL_00215 [Shigella flexneri]